MKTQNLFFKEANHIEPVLPGRSFFDMLFIRHFSYCLRKINFPGSSGRPQSSDKRVKVAAR